MILIKYPFPVLLWGLLAITSCNRFGDSCACDDVIRYNVCVAGKYVEGEDSIRIVRERTGNIRDTVSGRDIEARACFPETSMMQRIIVEKAGARMDSTSWFKQEKLDCCRYKDTVIAF